MTKLTVTFWEELLSQTTTMHLKVALTWLAGNNNEETKQKRNNHEKRQSSLLEMSSSLCRFYKRGFRVRAVAV